MFDQHAARELELSIDNTEAFYKMKIAIFKNYALKKDKGQFLFDKAIKGFLPLVARAAKTYVREFGSMGDKWQNMFSVVTRKHVAEHFVKEFNEWHREDWPNLKPVKKTRAKRS